MVLLGFVLLVELTSFTTIGAAQGKHFAIAGRAIDTTSPLPWGIALVALGLGVLVWRLDVKGHVSRDA